MGHKTIFILFLVLAFGAQAQQITYDQYANHEIVIAVPPGNRNVESPPEPPQSTLDRLVRTNETFDQKFNNAMYTFSRDVHFLRKIKDVGALYQIDPAHILGAIIGEHTFNVNIWDSIGGYAAEAQVRALGWTVRFNNNSISLADLIHETPFAECHQRSSEFQRWNCISNVWESQYRGRAHYPNDSLRMAFFNPLGKGFTYGLGQLDPLRVLMVTDLVENYSGFPHLSVDDPAQIYLMIMNPETTIHYVAASIKLSIQTYKEVANFDISFNMGVIATLYNLGRDDKHARELYEANKKNLSEGRELRLPKENFYGWAMNFKENEIRYLIQNEQWTPGASLDNQFHIQ